jgi:hypothetical protein
VAEGRRVEAVSALEGPQGQGALDALEAEVSHAANISVPSPQTQIIE